MTCFPRGRSKILPSVEMVTTFQGMNLPLAWRARFTACSIPPQQGTFTGTSLICTGHWDSWLAAGVWAVAVVLTGKSGLAARPELVSRLDSLDSCDTVFLGFPNWWGQAPRIISTFLERYDFSGKTIVPFCTSGSSGIGSSAQNLHSLTDGANWLDGRRFSGGTSRDTMVEWVNSLGLDIGAD